MSLTAVLVSATLLGAASQPPHPGPPQTEPTTVDEVVVLGRPLRELVDDFVDEVVEPPRRYGPARWSRQGGVCVGAVNLRRDTAQILIDRVSQVASNIGLEIGEPGCRPNVLILATTDGPALATALVQSRPRAFRPSYSGAARSSEALEAFQAGEQAVRWWHVSMPVTESGQPAVNLPGRGPAIIAGQGGLLSSPIRNALLRSFIIIDFARAEGVSLQQLGDYVAMVALAQINPDANLAGYPTVLNIFADPNAADSLTDWDRSYLNALYDAELNQRNPNAQTGAVGGVMLRDQRRSQSGNGDE